MDDTVTENLNIIVEVDEDDPNVFDLLKANDVCTCIIVLSDINHYHRVY